VPDCSRAQAASASAKKTNNVDLPFAENGDLRIYHARGGQGPAAPEHMTQILLAG